MRRLVKVLGAVAAVSMLSSTREQRDAASKRLKRYNWLFAAIAILLWGCILFR